MMRGRCRLGLLVVPLLVAACSGSDDAEPATTLAPTTTESVAETTTAEVPTTTTSSTTSTTEPPAPSTTLSDAEIEEQLAADVEAAYLAAYDAYHAALLDPSDPALREPLPLYLTGDALENTVGILDDLAAQDVFALANPDVPAMAMVTSDIEFVDDERTEAVFTVCEINSELFFQDGQAPDGGPVLLRETIIRVDAGVRLRLVDGDWKQASGGNSIDFPGVETCDEL